MSGCTDESELELPDDQEFALGLIIDFHLSAADKLEEMIAALTAWKNGKRPSGDASVETVSYRQLLELHPRSHFRFEQLLRSHAHAIKGTAANMGFLRYTEIAKRIELPFKSLLELKDFDGEILQAGASRTCAYMARCRAHRGIECGGRSKLPKFWLTIANVCHLLQIRFHSGGH